MPTCQIFRVNSAQYANVRHQPNSRFQVETGDRVLMEGGQLYLIALPSSTQLYLKMCRVVCAPRQQQDIGSSSRHYPEYLHWILSTQYLHWILYTGTGAARPHYDGVMTGGCLRVSLLLNVKSWSTLIRYNSILKVLVMYPFLDSSQLAQVSI